MRYKVFVLALIVPLCLASGYVPVVLWNNIGSDKCVPNVPIYPGESISELTESSYFECLRSLHPDLVKVFVADELDQHDFSVTRGASGEVKAFQHLQAALRTHSSLVMPAVSSKSVPAILEKLFRDSFDDSAVSVIDVGRIDHSSLASTRRSIELIDETMSEDLLKNEPSKKFIAVLVAMSPPQPLFHTDDELYHGRQLLTVTEPFSPSAQQLVHYNTCIFLSYSSLTLKYQQTALNLTEPIVEGGYCNASANNASIDLKFQAANVSGSSNTDVKLGLKFERAKSSVSLYTWWKISDVSVVHSVGGSEQNYTFKIYDSYSYTSPDEWSWVCEKPKAMSFQGGTKEKPIKQTLQFKNFQLQPFSIKNSTYSRALDCSGFLTAPIWMGTVVSILLIIILTFGLLFISAVTTMDRFDDPRSKGLSINVQEN